MADTYAARENGNVNLYQLVISHYNSLHSVDYISLYYMPINDTPFELHVFWPSYINGVRIKLPFTESVFTVGERK